ncbi:GntR family transcriptional regulator [Plantactinospora solaniradicis]|uniref:GntR family transcriptional regulator n=1 Tax=Plantactinospora solaniradicis TaxID=1723736 RepID=A0ABW1KF93_9ACTN
MDNDVPSPLPARSNLKDEVARHLRDLILSGVLRPGERLDQDGIAAELRTSRLPVREALITLQVEGLVENIARRGSFVARLEPQDISDHYEMYGLLSGLAAGRAAESPDSRRLVDQLAGICDEMRAATDPRERDRLNFAFHQAINKAGSSGRLRAVLRMLSNSMPTYFFAHASGSPDPDRAREWEAAALDEHDLIVAALRTRDSRAASEATANHFRRTGRQAVERLWAAGLWPDTDETP